MDVVALGLAKADAKRGRSRLSRQLFGMLPGPVCAGRASKPGSFTALTGVTFQGVYTMYAAVPAVRLAFPLFGLPGSANATPEQYGGPVTFKASVIWGYNNGSGGTYVPVFFNGSRTVTTVAGQTVVLSDPIDVPPSQGAGSYFVVRTYVTQAARTVTDGVTNSTTTVTSATANFIPADINAGISGAGIPGGATITNVVSSTQVSISSAATATASGVSLTITPKYLPNVNPPITGAAATYNPSGWAEGYLSGDFTDTSGNSWGGATNDGTTGYRPVVCGWPVTASNRSTLCLGDSIMAGTNWSVESGTYSFGPWALHQASVGAVNAAHSGEQLTTVLASYANQRARLSLAASFPNVIDQYGTNDVFAAGRTLAQVKADLLTWWGYLAGKGCSVWRVTLLPRAASSSDSYRTVAGQTLTGGTETIRQQLNQWLRAPASAGAGNSALYDAGGNLAGVFDIGLALEVNADGSAIAINAATGAISNGTGGYWKVDATQYDSGTVTSIPTSTKLQDTAKAWTTNQWVDYAMVILTDTTTPAAVGQVRVVAANTNNTLTTDTAWTTNPSTVATYALIKVYTADGVHPLTFGHLLAAAKVDATKLLAA